MSQIRTGSTVLAAWIVLVAAAPAAEPTAQSSAAPAASADTPVKMGWDSEMTIAGVGLACTGIGGTKDDPKWLAYPLRIEFANRAREYLINATVALSDGNGARLFTVVCPGAWLLLKLPSPAAYRVDALVNGRAAPTSTVKSPAKGQTRVILVFPE
jgi:hypothetical protein